VDDGRGLAALLARITDPDPLMRADAAERLGALGDATALPALVNALQDREWRVCAAAAGALGRLGDARATVPLCQSLDHRKAEVRRAAAGALEALGDGTATAALILALERERDYETQRLLIRAVGTVGDDRALHPLQKLAGAKHWAVRREAATAAARLMKRISD
jgi:HEAT repeat protein